MAYSYDRRASTSPELRDLAKKMAAVIKKAGYDKAQVKASGRTVVINLTGQGRADWMVMDADPVSQSLSGYIYFGPIPVQQAEAFVWEEASEGQPQAVLARRRASLYRHILKVLGDKLREAS